MSELRRRLMMQQAGGGGGVLPPEYQQVEWIKQTNAGGQYFLFDFAFDPLTDAMELEQDYVTDYGGTRTSFGYRLYHGSVTNALYSVGGMGFWVANDTQSEVLKVGGTPKSFKCGNNIIEINGTVFSPSIVFTNTPKYKFTWGALNDAGVISVPYINLYFISLKISRNGVKFVNLVPCYRKSDNVAGMYDIINNVFYTNAGSGSFEVGPDVN